MMELVACRDPREWEDLLAGQPRATVFHHPEWLEVIAAVSGAELRLFRIERGGRVVGGVPLFFFRRGPFRLAASPPPQAAAPYLGPLVEAALGGEALRATAEAARAAGAGYVEVRLDYELEAAAVAAAGFEGEARATYVLDLTPGPEALWKSSLQSGCRRAVRKAEASGVAIEEVELAGFLDRYHEMAASVFAKWDREPPLSRADYERIAAVQRRGECVKVFAARLEGRIVAAGVFPFGNGAVYYLDGVSDPEGQAARPNNLLHWEVIRWAHDAGLTRYDMVGAGIAGVARFKETFGPALVPYTYAYRTLNPLTRLARAAYARLAPLARAARYRLSRRT
jgi:CelD/BcsL family acetyltransferase involved in cellulose biosynthesis